MTHEPSKDEKRLTLSVVTISWNQLEDIIEYLDAMDAVRKETFFEIESIIVDNGSQDGTPDHIRRNYPWVKVIENGANLGFAKGCNVGLQASSGEYVMLFNPDARAVKSAFEGMLRFLMKHPEVGGIGCQMMHDDGMPQLSAYNELSPLQYWRNHSFIYPAFEKLKKWGWKTGITRKTKPFTCGWVQASCLMVPRPVYQKVGDMEDSFFIYCEDTDWCHRIRRAGYKIVHMPNLSLPHRQMGSVKRKPEFFFRRVYRSLVHYTNRQFQEPKRTRIFRTMMLDMKLRRPVYRFFLAINPKKYDRYRERLKSVDRMIEIIAARNPDLYDDPPPR